MSDDPNTGRESRPDSAARFNTGRMGRRLYWSIRRELWENRSILLVPLVVAALALAGLTIGLVQLPRTIREVAALDPVQQQTALERPYSLAAYLFMGTTFVLAIFYCLDALQGERRDRSILFWKSLPVSDVTAVVAKASVPLVILPLMSIVLTIVVNFLMLVLSSLVLTATGNGVGMLWSHVSLIGISWLLLYHMVAVHALWYAPIYAWLLLVSAWSRRAAFLWAIVPVLALGLIERMAFNTSYIANLVMSRLSGGDAGTVMNTPGNVLDPMTTHVSVWGFISSPGLWVGLLVAAAFLAAAVRLRRDSTPA